MNKIVVEIQITKFCFKESHWITEDIEVWINTVLLISYLTVFIYYCSYDS